ncbi:hypothetical protein [Nocardia sp. NPDC002869]|uniref:hypothetical protein n=1 Tax=Nocardia sp. NPDC002869 TaxID=3161032 RepID=UPI00398C998E
MITNSLAAHQLITLYQMKYPQHQLNSPTGRTSGETSEPPATRQPVQVPAPGAARPPP